ncbi:FAD/NAD(P)-binding domain-containing protein [Aureobasidium sp. EXF-3400]|nr:FAD/NAD(P)-binding domain-containing protein [Aureobasidium sp. EXF-3400]
MAAEIATIRTDVPNFFDEKEAGITVVETTRDVLQDVVEINKDVSEEDWVYPYPTDFVLGDHPIDDVRELKRGGLYLADDCQVAVIGAGLAGITAGALLPAKVPGIQLTIFEKNPEVKVASHLDHYARSPTWIAGSFNGSARERQATPLLFTAEELDSFKDPTTYLKFRKELEGPFFRRYDAVLRDSETSKNAARDFKELMRKRLVEKPELLDQIVPDFPPHCRRLTPGPGYLEAITKPNVSFIQTPISHFTEEGIVTQDGIHRPVDAVICSTGANVDFSPPFPVVAGDYDLSRDWRPDGKFGWPYSYIGVATPGFPNLLHLAGPNAAGASGSVPFSVETQVAYIAKVLRKVSSQGISTLQPSKAATDDFVTYCDAFFPRTTFSRKCSSWANGRRAGARIHGQWPGSASHLAVVRREPRWEDWEYTYVRPENRFAYWGNGRSRRELDPEGNVTAHLKLPEKVDLRDLHETWWDL